MKTNKNIYKFKILKDRNLICGISKRSIGSMKNKGKINNKNLKKFSDALGIDSERLILAEQVHSSDICHAVNFDRNMISGVDGFITKKKNLFLGILTADCLPVVFYDPRAEVVGVVHAGYRGILKGIIQKMIKNFKSLKCSAGNILVGIGPSIERSCYEVNCERIKIFKAKLGNLLSFEKISNKYFLDLKDTALKILLSEGIAKNHIEITPICTRCDSKNYFSYRRENKKNYGEMATIIGTI